MKRTDSKNAGDKNNKKKGKYVRSNETIGSLPIAEANRLAAKLTGVDVVDLELPLLANYVSLKRGNSGVASGDAVFQRRVCMICFDNPLDPFFGDHFREVHAEEDNDVLEVILRMNEVRVAKFFARSVVEKSFIQANFPRNLVLELESFLASCGFVVRTDDSIGKDSVEDDWGKLHEEAVVRGVEVGLARDIALVLTEDNSSLPVVEFPECLSAVARGDSVYREQRVYCYLCDDDFRLHSLQPHIQRKHEDWLTRDDVRCAADDVAAILRRLWEVRLARFYAANPVPAWKVASVCNDDVDAVDKLSCFLLNNGFVIDRREKSENVAWGIDESASDAESRLSYSLSTDDDCASTSSRASSVSSSTSSSSTLSVKGFPCFTTDATAEDLLNDDYPYCVLRAITDNIIVEKLLYEIVSLMDADQKYVLDSKQYLFLLGYASLALVVANGCKMNVVSRLNLGDLQNPISDSETGLKVFSFSSTSTASGGRRREFVAADHDVWRVMEIFLVARQRLVVSKAAHAELLSEHSAVFLTYSLIRQTKDPNYPMSQFLKMIGIEWACRSGTIVGIADALVYRDRSLVSSSEYSKKHFLKLREKEKDQLRVIGMIEEHRTIRRIKFNPSLVDTGD